MTQITTPTHHSLSHHFLIASPDMPDERFADTLIYLCRHTKDGAWGFVINRPLSLSVGALLDDLGLPTTHKNHQTPAMNGGVIRPEAGFVLHTGLPNYLSSFAIGENVCLTTSKDILQKIIIDEVPHFLMCMGFCQWSKGQLEHELGMGDWLVCPADLKILFDADFDDRLSLAYQKIGINPDRYTPTIGYA